MQLKNKTLSVMQPTFFPWIGYFHLINLSDIFIIYDDTQLVRRSWQLRNRIKTNNGELYLSIPVKKSETRDNLIIKKAEINYENIDWKKKHLKSIFQSYCKSPFFETIFPLVKKFYDKSPKYLVEITIPIIISISNLLGIKTKILFSSDITYNGKKEMALISMCKKLKASDYISVKGSMNYILNNQEIFYKNNINLIWHEFDHPKYNQLYNNFLPYMGIIDALFNIGIEETSKLIQKK